MFANVSTKLAKTDSRYEWLAFRVCTPEGYGKAMKLARSGDRTSRQWYLVASSVPPGKCWDSSSQRQDRLHRQISTS